MVNWSYLCLFAMRVLWRHDWSNLGLATFFELWSFGCGRSRGTFCFVVCFISRNYFVWYVVYSGSGTNWFPTEIDSSNTWQYPLNISTSRNIKKNSDFVFWNSEHHRQNLPTWFSKKSQRNSGISSLPETNKQDANDTNLKEPPRL